MIQTQGITKSFGNLQVLKGIDLTINKGEVVAIVGPAVPETTLLQIIGTLDTPDNGKLFINENRNRQTFRKRTGCLPKQEYRLCISVPPAATGIYSVGKRYDPGTDCQGKGVRCRKKSEGNT